MTNKEILHKFFRGTTTHQEEVMIRKWMEEGKENETAFFQERILYDSLLLNNSALQNSSNKFKPQKTDRKSVV